MTANAPQSCPSPGCDAGWGEITWAGGAPPYGRDRWRCDGCGVEWTTPPVRVAGPEDSTEGESE